MFDPLGTVYSVAEHEHAGAVLHREVIEVLRWDWLLIAGRTDGVAL